MNRIILAAALAAFAAPAARAADANDVLRFSPQLQSLKFGGDLRLREEKIDRHQGGSTDRNRLRYRLRAGIEMGLPDDVMAAVRLGAGTGEQTSNNQTFDNLGQQKQIFVDLAYMRWLPSLSDNVMLRLGGGKTPNWLWRINSSDLLWDDDFNPEGFQESVEWLAPAGVSVFANLMQMVADEDAGRAQNQWLFSYQGGLETRLPWETRLRTALAYHKWSDENHSNFGPQIGVNDGNRRAGAAPGTLVNRFGVGEWTSELSGWAGKVPVRAQLTLARNFRARGDLAGPTAADGHQFGFIVGRAKLQGQWELGLFRKYAQTDVSVADVADSDFGEGGTNRQGGIFWVGYALRDWASARAKYSVTDVIDTQFAPGDKPVDRLQFDVQIAF